MTTKAKVKEETEDSFLDPVWRERLTYFGGVFLQGVAFGLGGIAANRVASSITQKRLQNQIAKSENVIDFKEAVNS